MVEQAEQQISVAEFLSVAIFLAEESGKVIRHVEQTGFEALKKGDDSPVTEADIRVQKTIEENLKYLYPTLNIQGEESKEATAAVDSAVSSDKLTDKVKSFVSQAFLNDSH